MTVETEKSTEIHNGDGTSISFAVTFYFLANSDLRIIRRKADGGEAVEAPQTITGAGNASGGTVTLNSPLLTGEQLHIIRWPAKTQLTRLVNANNLPPETVEKMVDRLLMLHQANWKLIEKAVRLPETYSGTALTMPEPVNGQDAVLGFDTSGRMVASTDFKTLHDAAVAASQSAVAAASSVSNPLDKTKNLSDLADKSAARNNLEVVGTKTASTLMAGVTVIPQKNGDVSTSFTVDHSARGIQTLKVGQNFTLHSDSIREGVSEILLKNNSTGGYAIDSSSLNGGFFGTYNNAANKLHHITLYTVKDQDDVQIRWGYIKELSI